MSEEEIEKHLNEIKTEDSGEDTKLSEVKLEELLEAENPCIKKLNDTYESQKKELEDLTKTHEETLRELEELKKEPVRRTMAEGDGIEMTEQPAPRFRHNKHTRERTPVR